MGLIKLDHTKLDNAAYIVRARELHGGLNGNANFPSTAAHMAGFLSGINTLVTRQDATGAAQIAAKQEAIQRDVARASVEDEIRILANLCEADAPNDTGKLQSAGWHLRADSAPVGAMTAPQNVVATGGDLEGEIDLVWEPVHGRNSYIGEQAPNVTGPWTQFYVEKKSSCTATGLTPGQSYWFRIRAVGTSGPGPWSDPTQGRAS